MGRAEVREADSGEREPACRKLSPSTRYSQDRTHIGGSSCRSHVYIYTPTFKSAFKANNLNYPIPPVIL